MSKVVLISVATSVGLGLLSLHLLKQMKEGDATIVKLQAQVSQLEQQLQQQPAALPRADNPPPEDINPKPSEVIGTPPKEPPKMVGVITGPAAMPPPPPDREATLRMMREHRERQRQLMQDPEYREAMRVQARSNLARQYPGVIQELGLDAQQADQFFDMLAEQQLRANERMEPLWDSMNGDRSDPAVMQDTHRKIQQAAQENQRANEAEMAALLGQQKVQAWKEYQSSMGMRYQLDHMRNTLSAHGIPLSEELSKPMLKAMAQAQQAEADAYSAAVSRGAAPALAAARIGFSGAPDGANMERHLEDQKKRNQRILDAISPYLSYEQRSAIEKEQEAQLKMQEAQYRIMRAQRKANPNSNNGFFVEASGLVVAQP